jgi:hypothetical protein
MVWFTTRDGGSRSPSRYLYGRPRLEALESRIVPYSTTRNLWPSPQLVTISFVPDGTWLTSTSQSNLFATLNAKMRTATWQGIILKAAQVWAQQTNINFALVSDNGTGAGGGSYQQGDPGMGDIRVGGYNFGASELAGTYYPPPANNFSIAGDIDFNTGKPWNDNGQNYDLFTVAVHEMGHALGMGHSAVPSAVMFSYYNRVKSALTTDDINGIRSIYGGGNPRSGGAYEPDGSFSQAANISSQIDTTSLTALITGVDVTTAGELEYYTFTVPSGTSGTMVVNVQSSGLSLLAPTLTVYNSSEQQIGYQSGAGQYGTTLSVTITGVSSGEQYYVEVAGADATAFGTGAYALTLNFGTGSNPTVPLPNTQDPNGNPEHSGGGTPEKAPVDNDVTSDGFGAQPASSSSQVSSATPTSSTNVVLFIPVASVAAYPTFAIPTASGSQLAAAAAQSAILVPSARAPLLPPVVGSRVESGGGEDSSSAPLPIPDLDDLVPAAVPALPDAAVAGGLPAAFHLDLASHGQPSLQHWRALTSKCFSESVPATPVVRSEPRDMATSGQKSPVLNSAAASAVLLMALGSYWNVQPAEQDRPGRRPLRS